MLLEIVLVGFLILFFSLLLLVYRNTLILCVDLIICNLAKSSYQFQYFVYSLGFSTYTVLSSAQKDSFTFANLCAFSLSLYCLIILANTFNITLNRNSKSRYFDLLPNLGEECSACRFLVTALYQIEKGLFDSLFSGDSFLTWQRGIEIFQMLFLQLLLEITFFLFFFCLHGSFSLYWIFS